MKIQQLTVIRSMILFTCLPLLLCLPFAQAEECSGRGKLDESGVCICDNDFPSEQVNPAYTGEDCSVPVHFATLTGEDLTTACSSSDNCNHISAGEWVCFGAELPQESGWNYVAVLLNQTSVGGDPDLYGYFHPPAARPTFKTSPSGFDFQETGSKPMSRVTLDNVGQKGSGVVLCVHAYGSADLTFSLHASGDVCPSTFSPHDATPLICSTPKDAPSEDKRYSECTAAGQCMCTGQWAKPEEEIIAGLGFEDCSASVTKVDLNQVVQLEEECIEEEQWRYYQFNVTDDDYQVVVTVMQASQAGRLDLFAKAGSPPGFKAQQFDLKPKWNAATDDRSLELSIDQGLAQFRPGVWFVGVIANADASYDFTIAKYSCPFNCSGNGDCDVERHSCTCNKGFGGPACSISQQQILFNEKVSRNASSGFEYEYYQLPPISKEMLEGNVEVIIEVSMQGLIHTHHLEARPAVLIMKDNSFPTTSNFSHRLMLDADGVARTLSIFSAHLTEGEWKLAVYNPAPTYSLNYTILVSRVAHCLNECSEHGTCTENGVCECKKGWLGGDCSVNQASSHPQGRSALGSFWFMVLSMAAGAAGTLTFIHFKGVPQWLPIRVRYFEGLGLYQELSGGNDGI